MTAMQEFVSWLNEHKQDMHNKDMAWTIYDKAKKLLETERQQLKQSFETFQFVGFPHNKPTWEEYYNKISAQHPGSEAG